MKNDISNACYLLFTLFLQLCTVYFNYITSDVFPYGDETNEDESGSYIIVGYYQQQIFFGEFYIFLPP